ncbi:MAG TPA: hypothetical protein PK040_00150 [Anaerolineaceae bacterium]|nr:hypothetical protein [Anaerolineaceae bacterium]
MTWTDVLKGDSLTWLMESKSPAVRHAAVRDLLDTPPGGAGYLAVRQAAHASGPIAHILDQMDPEGWWQKPGPGYGPKYRSSVWALQLLAQLGASVEADARIATACRYMLDHALAEGGRFSYNKASGGTFDCLQGNLTWALLELGYWDERLAAAFDWLARSQTGEGVAQAGEKHALVKYYAYKCGPNFACGANGGQPCAWGAVKVMMAFGKVPLEMRTPLIERGIQKGVEFLFSVDPATAAYPTPGGIPPNRAWWKFGFPVFYITDLLQLAHALAALGYGRDARLAKLVDLILSKQDANGRWMLEYDYSGKTWLSYGKKGEPSEWVTLRALKFLKLAFA